MRLDSSLLAVLILSPCLTGCLAAAGVAAGGAAVVGVSAARQERTIGNAVDDIRIKTAVESGLAHESAGMFFKVSTTVVEGRVLLAGRAETPEARLEATRIAWAVEGVRKVDNEIEVAEGSGWLDGPQDLYLRTRVAASLLGDKSIKDVNYTTDVVHGVVYLMGVAQDQGEIDRAVARAEKIGGVKKVESYVVLKNDPIRYGFASPPPPE